MTSAADPAVTRGRWRWAAAVGAALVLLLVFAAYLRPEMMMQMAQQIWSCF